MPRPGLQRKRAAAALSQAGRAASRARSVNTRHPAGRPQTTPANRMYATDVRQTDVRQHRRLMPPGRDHNKQVQRHSILLLRSIPIRPTRPASRVTRSCLRTSGADDFTRAQGSTAFTHTRLINKSSAALTNFPTPADSRIGLACEPGLSIDV